MNEDQIKTRAVIQKSVKPAPVIEKAKPKDYLVSVSRIVLIVIVLIVAYHTLKNSFLGSRLAKVNTEIWITLIAGATGAYWKFYTDNEKVKIATAQANAVTNAQAIKALDLRIDSALIQIQDLKSIQLNDASEIERLDKLIDELKGSLADQRHRLLLERIELIQEFYREICKIHSHISYKKGITEGIEKVLANSVEESQALQKLLEPERET